MTSHAFDLANWLPTTPAQEVGDAVVVAQVGPPLASTWVKVVAGGIGVPAATAENQIIVSGPPPGFIYGVEDIADAIGSSVITNHGGTILAGYGLTLEAGVIDGVDPNASSLANFSIDCGQF